MDASPKNGGVASMSAHRTNIPLLNRRLSKKNHGSSELLLPNYQLNDYTALSHHANNELSRLQQNQVQLN